MGFLDDFKEMLEERAEKVREEEERTGIKQPTPKSTIVFVVILMLCTLGAAYFVIFVLSPASSLLILIVGTCLYFTFSGFKK